MFIFFSFFTFKNHAAYVHTHNLRGSPLTIIRRDFSLSVSCCHGFLLADGDDSQLASEFVTRPRAEKYVRGLGLTRVRSTRRGREARKDETPRPDRAERRRNGLAKLVPTLKPRNGLNDSWRVGGCGHFVPVSTPSLVGETPSTFSFLFSRDVPFVASVFLGGLSRALSKEEEGSWQAARKKDSPFLPSFRNYPRVILHEN